MRPKKRSLRAPLRAVTLVGSFGLMMGASIFAGYYVGSYIDQRFGTEPWFMLIFLILFMIGAFIKFIQSTKEVCDTGKKQNKAD